MTRTPQNQRRRNAAALAGGAAVLGAGALAARRARPLVRRLRGLHQFKRSGAWTSDAKKVAGNVVDWMSKLGRTK